MKKKLHRIFKIIMAIALVFSISTTINVNALDCSVYKKDEGAQIIKDFGINLTEKNGKYVITVKPKSSNSNTLKKMRNTTFKVVRIKPSSGNENLIGSTVKAGDSGTGTLELAIKGKTDTSRGPGVEIKLQADASKVCGDHYTKIEVELAVTDYNGEKITHEDTIKENVPEKKVEDGIKIPCDNFGTRYQAGSFEYKFCKAKHYATHNKPVYSKTNDGQHDIVNFTDAFTSSKVLTLKDLDKDNTADFMLKNYSQVVGDAREFKCSPTVTQKYEDALKSEENYYKDNTKYMYGSGEKTVNLGKYQYHYQNEKATPGSEIKCKVKCEEALIVKYGPPVATKAGLCFEYRIKVESMVTCYMSQKPPKPEKKTTVCTPTPRCVSSYGAVYNQGGPSDEYDQCIKDCDGGKYTDKCSKSCYKDVYGEIDDSLDLINNIEKTADSSGSWMTYGKFKSVSKAGNKAKDGRINGFYYNTGNGVVWRPGGTRGRWYFNHSWGFNHPYPRTEAGIPRSANCTDTCYWVNTCSEDEYINYGLAQWDYDKNMELYNKAIDKCKAQASCSKSSAEFIIKASYSRKKTETETETVWVKFPYSPSDNIYSDKSTKKDSLPTCTCKSTDEYNNSCLPNTAGNEYTSILKYAGCYENKCDVNNYYMTEWTIPGTWVNKKTGEISFTKPEKETAWREYPKNLCIPRDAESVNAAWARWYYHTIEKVSGDYLCPDTGTNNIESIKNFTYNIKGTTTKFGYFGWKMNFECFYAIDVNSPPAEGGKEDICVNNTQYKIRTVSNSELFPSSAGTTTTSGTTTGRSPGYNWTSDSKLAEGKTDENFVNDPDKVKKYIQKTGNSIYNGVTYVDYEFELTPDDLNKIKAYNKQLLNKGYGFDVYCGKMEEINQTYKITGYKSNLFNSGIDSNTWAHCDNVNKNFIKAKNIGNIRCNNDGEGNTCNTSY